MRSIRSLPLLLWLLTLCLALPQTIEAKSKKDHGQSAGMKDSGTKKKKKKKKKDKKEKKEKKEKKQKSGDQGGRYPLKVNARPLVLPQGMGQVNGGLTITSVPLGKKTINSSSLGVGFDYGVAQGLELGGSTGLLLSPDFDWTSSFNLRGGYLIKGQRRGLSLAARLEIPLNFGEGQDVLSSINAGLSTRYSINKHLALHTGDGMISINFADELTTTFNIPVGVAYQFNKKFNLRLDTRLMSAGSGDTVSVADTLPINLRAIYAIQRMMDAGVALNTDLINDSGFSIMALFNYRIR